MLDTVKLESPELGGRIAGEIERRCVRRTGVVLDSGDVLYEITAGSLAGSWDSRMSVRVMRERWTGAGELQPCAPYVLLEGSVHKALLGHNVHGGPEGLQASCEWLLDDVGGRVGVKLPPASE